MIVSIRHLPYSEISFKNICEKTKNTALSFTKTLTCFMHF